MIKLSRSKIDLFLQCPRCFWLDVKRQVKRPQPAPYTINNAVDYLLKQEFDVYREKGEPHPIMIKAGIDAIPYAAPEMNQWRHNFTGVRHEDEQNGFLVFGAVDDIWINPAGELIVVDYKATGANQHKIHESYPRQMEIYQWLLQRNNYKVSPTGYFVFARANKAKTFGHGQAVLPFDIFVEPLQGDPGWIPGALAQARKAYDKSDPPAPAEGCEYCRYRADAGKAATAPQEPVPKKTGHALAQGKNLTLDLS